MSSEQTKFCSFCGLSQNEVATLIQGPEIWICNNCVEICQEILVQDPKYYPISEEVQKIVLPGSETTIGKLRAALSKHHFDTKVRIELKK